MNAAIPCDIDETDEPAVVIGADMGEAAGQDAGEIRCGGRAPGGGPEGWVKSSGEGSMRSSGMGGSPVDLYKHNLPTSVVEVPAYQPYW